MDHFEYRQSELFAEDLPVAELAERFGTPCFVYSRATIERHFRAFDHALADHPHLICYAVKANSNLAVLDVLARLGAGFDIVSVGELERVLAAGGDPSRVVFSGVAKQEHEIARALEVGIRCFNVESTFELDQINALALAHGVAAPVSLRVNPDVDPGTHPYISTGLRENKFGIDVEAAESVYLRAAGLPGIVVRGIDFHIGSQLTSVEPFVDALDRVLLLTDRLLGHGIPIAHLDFGGGLGIRYRDENPPEPDVQARALLDRISARPLEILMEPGRAIAGNAGVLLTRVEYLKRAADKHFAIVDAAMNDLLRPALYSAWQEIIPADLASPAEPESYDVVGPICESGDFLGKGRRLSILPGDLLVVRSAGAYGFVMSSNYNSRPRAAEVMVDGDRAHLVRRRETVRDLFSGESLLPRD